MRGILEMGGYEVLQAHDGIDGLRQTIGRHPDLVIVDVNMPNMSGTDYVHRLRSESSFQDLPILVISAEHSDQHRREAQAAGATAWMMKPTRPNTLLKAIRDMLE